MSKYCMNCGSPIDEDSKFCGACGAPCEPTPADTTPEPLHTPDSQETVKTESEVPYAQALPFEQPAQQTQEQFVQQPQEQFAQQAAAGYYQQQSSPAGYPAQGGQQGWQPYNAGYQQPANAPRYGGAPVNSGQYGQPPVNGQYGQPQYAPYPQQTNYYNQPQKKSKAPLFIILAVAVVAVAAVIITSVFSGAGSSDETSGPEGVMDQYVRYTFTSERDADKLASLIYEYEFNKDPEEKEYLLETFHEYLDDDDFDASLKEEYGDDYKVTYKITEAEVQEGSDFEDVLGYFSDCYTNDIEQAVFAEVELYIEGSKSSDDNSMYLYFIKANGKWYVDEDVFL